MKKEHPQVLIDRQTYSQIMQTLGALPPEHGGILGADRTGTVSAFAFDHAGESSANSYTPHIPSLNAVLAEQWAPKGIRLIGMVHSHTGSIVPSCGDISYADKLRRFNGMDLFHLPIVALSGSGAALHYYVISGGSQEAVCKCVPCQITEKEKYDEPL